MKLRNCIFVSTTMLMSLISSKIAFAGDSLFDIAYSVSDKPNTGDSNTLIIYASVIGIALIALIFVNCTGKSKNNTVKSSKDGDTKEDSDSSKLDDDLK